MTTKLANAGSLKAGSYILIEGAPCKVTDVSTSKPGKHGSAKARIVAVGIIDDKKREIVCPASESVEVPILEKKSAQVLSITGKTANVMDMDSYETFDLPIPLELQGQVVDGVQILYWQILNDRIMKQLKT